MHEDLSPLKNWAHTHKRTREYMDATHVHLQTGQCSLLCSSSGTIPTQASIVPVWRKRKRQELLRHAKTLAGYSPVLPETDLPLFLCVSPSASLYWLLICLVLTAKLFSQLNYSAIITVNRTRHYLSASETLTGT